ALRGRARHGELYEVLAAQAGALERRGDAARGGELWELAARLAEVDMGDPALATEAYRRACEARPQPAALEALARLYESQEQPERAARWLETRLELEQDPPARTALALRLARAHAAAGATDRSIAILQAAAKADPASVEVRADLAAIYRTRDDREPLAALLTDGLPHAPSGEQALADATEAVALFRDIGAPERAIPALEHALALAAEDAPERRALRAMLAEALRAAGRAADAETILRELVDSYGRRRSPERAAAHVELARAIRAQDRLDDAAAELAVAARMDAGNPLVMRESAEVARARDKLDDAERQYRALLLVVRRRADPAPEAVGASEVLYELSRLARARGDEVQAAELCESALGEAQGSDIETRRFGRVLRAAGDHPLLHRALEARLAATGDGPGRIDLFIELGQLRAAHLNDGAGAVTAMIDALALDPTSERVLALARELSRAVSGGPVRFAAACGDIASGLRRKEEQDVAAQLYLAAGAALEFDAEDLDAAYAVYDQARATGGRLTEAFTALARVAQARGDSAGQIQAFEGLSELAAQAPVADRADALYQLAALQVDVPDRRAAAVALIREALAAQPRPARAAALLAKVAAALPQNAEIMELYQETARASGEPALILDALVLRARQADAVVAEIQEATKLALAQDDARSDELLGILADRAGDDAGGADAAWAGAALAERALARGDLETARDQWQRTLASGELAEAMALGLTIAERAAATADGLPLACTIYEALREREPTAQAIWQPLCAAYRQLGDTDRLGGVIAATLPNLVDPGERNVLRMEHAAFLRGRGEIDSTIECLRDVLLDEPGHSEAAALMEKVLVTAGRDDDLADFLAQQLEDARARRDEVAAATLGVRLGQLAEKRDEAAEAIDVYRAALELAPADRGLLAALWKALGETRAEPAARVAIGERLVAVEEPARAGRLASEVASLWSELDDAEGIERVLSLGHARAPDDDALQARLEGFYRDRGRWASLADLVAADARRQTDSAKAVARLREAASLMSAKLENPTRAAALLGEAHELAPDDTALLAALTSTLSAAGDPRGAAESLTAAIDRERGSARAELLARRADFWLAARNGAAAVDDLEQARNLAPEMTPRLREVLEDERARAANAGELDFERELTLKLLPLLMEAGDADRCRELLEGWLARRPEDHEALVALRDLELASERFAGVVRACERLVAITEQEEQVEAATALWSAAESLGEPALARAGLEIACRAQPGVASLGEKLRAIYEAAGAFADLGRLALADAAAAGDDDARFAALSRAAAMFLRDGDAAAALEPAREAYALRPDDHDAIVLASDALTAGGQIDEAVTILEPAIAGHKRRSPELAALLRRMAHVCAVRSDGQAQLGWLKKAFDVDRKDGELAAELAHLATELGDYDLALKPLRAISLMENPGPITRVMALLWEAKIEHARGNRAKAELWAKKALREDPDYADAQTFLAEIAE
ncbi:MAG TPA: tetratricopeptide repeat protein, partial [Kofleriaceae bacterium]|nr:tetratricopeptide repeat protein [Kofleriaceae bacterium]